jgi:head-tail adaptor
MTGASAFRHTIRFDKKVFVDDPGGGTTSSWQPQFTRKAALNMLRGGETVTAQRLAGTQPALIRVIRDSHTAQITPAWRAVEIRNGEAVRYFGIKTAADMEGKNREISMLCEAGAADA